MAINHTTQNLFKILRGAYFQKKPPEVSNNWHQQVMAQIHRLPPPELQPSFAQAFEHIVWKLTPATALMIAGCAVVLMQLEPVADWQLFQLLLTGLEETVYSGF